MVDGRSLIAPEPLPSSQSASTAAKRFKLLSRQTLFCLSVVLAFLVIQGAWAEDRDLVSAARSGQMRKLQRLWWDSQITKSKPIVIASNEALVTSQLAFLEWPQLFDTGTHLRRIEVVGVPRD
jgi:hypothetical protein